MSQSKEVPKPGFKPRSDYNVLACSEPLITLLLSFLHGAAQSVGPEAQHVMRTASTL